MFAIMKHNYRHRVNKLAHRQHHISADAPAASPQCWHTGSITSVLAHRQHHLSAGAPAASPQFWRTGSITSVLAHRQHHLSAGAPAASSQCWRTGSITSVMAHALCNLYFPVPLEDCAHLLVASPIYYMRITFCTSSSS